MWRIFIIIILSWTPHTAQETLPEWTLTREFKIGSVEGDPNYSLSAISSIAVARDGRMYVVLRQEKQVRMFDANGSFAGNIGRPGGGPGEFQRPTASGIFRDTLWVADPGLGRVTFFTLAGRPTRTSRPSSDQRAGAMMNLPECVFSDGSALARRPDNENVVTRWTLVRTDQSGTPLNTIVHVSNERATLVLEGENPFWRATRPAPFADAPLWSCSGDGNALFVVERRTASVPRNAQFTIHKYSKEGRRLVTRSFGYTPVPLDRRAVKDAITRFAQSIARYVGSDAEARSIVRKSMYIPRFRSPVSLVTAGHDGTLWLRRTSNPGTDKDALWNVYSAQLQHLAAVHVPLKAAIVAADHRHVWTIELDDADVPYVGRYRINREKAATR